MKIEFELDFLEKTNFKNDIYLFFENSYSIANKDKILLKENLEKKQLIGEYQTEVDGMIQPKMNFGIYEKNEKGEYIPISKDFISIDLEEYAVNNFADDLFFGQHLKVPKGPIKDDKVTYVLYTHHGIGIGNGLVIHYSGFADLNNVKIKDIAKEVKIAIDAKLNKSDEVKSSDKADPVSVTSVKKNFVNEKKVIIVEHKNPKFTRAEVVHRAFSRLGENEYKLLLENCEHFTNWAILDESKSNQVEKAKKIEKAIVNPIAIKSIISEKDDIDEIEDKFHDYNEVEYKPIIKKVDVKVINKDSNLNGNRLSNFFSNIFKHFKKELQTSENSEIVIIQ